MREGISSSSSSSSTYSPPIDERRWVEQGRRALDIRLEIDSTPTIFQVPKALKETKPEAYTPRLLGLGPYHHLRPDLHRTHTHKLNLINKFQEKVQESLPEFRFSPYHIMGPLEPYVRARYDKYLDLEGATLAYIIPVDSFFLLHFLSAYWYTTEVHSPLKLSKLWVNQSYQSMHLLDHMYRLIAFNDGSEDLFYIGKSRIVDEGVKVLTAASELGVGGDIVKPLLLAFKAIQVLENNVLANEIRTSTKNKEPEEEAVKKPTRHRIPSASQLSSLSSKKFRVDFKVMNTKGIVDVKLEEVEAGSLPPVLHLPEITFRPDAEVVLRNLVAYEASIATPESTLVLAEYVALMGDLLQAPEDVALLREKGIVKGSLDDEQIVKILAGIGKPGTEEKPEAHASEKVVRKLKEMVEEWEKKNETTWARLHRSIEKRVKDGVEVMRKPCAMALKYVLYIFLVVLVVLQLMQAYCQVYGCNKGGFKSK
ncbi:unnamed protein product [Cuscuta campestris]|uniref:Uncharacterized protein n=1 Tax=Cuscuta campestris TaxID=132261 RepID=A0A484KK32_9ASTE|nr:unnamed protein product [Cuscuta campestris]